MARGARSAGDGKGECGALGGLRRVPHGQQGAAVWRGGARRAASAPPHRQASRGHGVGRGAREAGDNGRERGARDGAARADGARRGLRVGALHRAAPLHRRARAPSAVARRRARRAARGKPPARLLGCAARRPAPAVGGHRNDARAAHTRALPRLGLPLRGVPLGDGHRALARAALCGQPGAHPLPRPGQPQQRQHQRVQHPCLGRRHRRRRGSERGVGARRPQRGERGGATPPHRATPPHAPPPPYRARPLHLPPPRDSQGT